MFSKKITLDVKKSTQKVLDCKKDAVTRLKHLKTIIDNVNSLEAKAFFELHYSHIYLIFYDNFISAENNLRQRVHKAHKEELELSLYLLEKILILLPELLRKKWQVHSLERIFRKLLLYSNHWKLRKDSIRLFLIWYQELGLDCPSQADQIYSNLIPGFSSTDPKTNVLLSQTSAESNAGVPFSSVEILPVLPSQVEKYSDDSNRFYLESILEFMSSQVLKVEWRDKQSNQVPCFNFLFEKFKKVYLPIICPQFSHEIDVYKQNLDLPELRKFSPGFKENDRPSDRYVLCRVLFIKWIANWIHPKSTTTEQTTAPSIITPVTSPVTSDENENRINQHAESSRSSLSNEVHSILTNNQTSCSDSESMASVVKDVLYNSRENVNLIFELFRQGYLLNFHHSIAIRKVISVYRDWIQQKVLDLPSFMLEPYSSLRPDDYYRHSSQEHDEDSTRQKICLRKESYLGAIHNQNLYARLGLQKVIEIFITQSSNVFLLELTIDYPLLLEEQIDICKKVLNIYRYMVMNAKMEQRTWEQLLRVLLRITELVVPKTPPKQKNEILGGRLAAALFQTLIVTWIKANLNVPISVELWNHFTNTLNALTCWDELIREWAKTMETLTKVMARHLYHLDLSDLPLDRLSEQKAKKNRALRQGDKPSDRKFSSAIPKVAGMQDQNVFFKHNIGPANVSDHIGITKRRTSSGDTSNHDYLGGDSNRKLEPRSPGMNRSFSEGNLRLVDSSADVKYYLKSVVSMQLGVVNTLSEYERCTLSPIVNDVLCKPSPLKRRSRSVDSILRKRVWTASKQFDDVDLEIPSTPSPVQFSSSFKDSPLHIESNEQSLGESNVDIHEHRSVMFGGHIKGWTNEVSVILWKRMLYSLGDVNLIADPSILAKVYEFQLELVITLIKIQRNQSPSELVPPISLVAPWCFKTLLELDHSKYQKACVLACQLLCTITIESGDQTITPEHFHYFIKILHLGLVGSDQVIKCTIIRNCGPRFFSMMIPGFQLLIYDFIYASIAILNSNDTKSAPRIESMSILGCLLNISSQIENQMVFDPNSPRLKLISAQKIQEILLNELIKFCCVEPLAGPRSVAISALGLYLYNQLYHKNHSHYTNQIVSVLLKCLKIKQHNVAKISVEVFYLFTEVVEHIQFKYQHLSSVIVEGLCNSLWELIKESDETRLQRDSEFLIISLIFCLGQWTIQLPFNYLFIANHNSVSLIQEIFKILQVISSGDWTHSQIDDDTNWLSLNNEINQLSYEFNPHVVASAEGQSTEQAESKNPVQNIQFAAKTVLIQLINNIKHFPLGVGASRMSSMVNEIDDLPLVNQSQDYQMNSEIFNAANIQFYVLNNEYLLSFVEIPLLEWPGSGITSGLKIGESQVRIIIRGLTGKYSWDSSSLNGISEEDSPQLDPDAEARLNPIDRRNEMEDVSIMPFNINICHQNTPYTIRHRNPNILPTCQNTADDMDNLDDLLQYIGFTSGECLENPNKCLNIPAKSPEFIPSQNEDDAITCLLNQRNFQGDYVTKHLNQIGFGSQPEVRSSSRHKHSPFQHCRLLFSELGLTNWEKRSEIHLLDKNDALLREIKNLDNQRCRETHKIAVIFVGDGQEDKSSILSNQNASPDFETFVAGLGWEIELENHTGFMGGLEKNGTTGTTAPYYANAFIEIIYHVSTRMPSHSEQHLLQKTRHLGNDEVHIIWSEHSRDYNRYIIPTDFCDVLIVIYPLQNCYYSKQLYRVQINRKPQISYFGPLFNEIIVDRKMLPTFIRTTALFASRSIKHNLPFYLNYYQERSESLKRIIKNHKLESSFEHFIQYSYQPSFPHHVYQQRADSFSRSKQEYLESQKKTHPVPAAAISPRDFRRKVTQPIVSVTPLYNDNISEDQQSHSSFEDFSPRPMKKLKNIMIARKTSSAAQPKSSEFTVTPPSSPTYKNKK